MFLRNPTVKKDSIQIVYKDKTGEITSLSFDFESIPRVTEPGKHIPIEQAKKKAMEHIQKLYGPVASQYQVLKVMPIEYLSGTFFWWFNRQTVCKSLSTAHFWHGSG